MILYKFLIASIDVWKPAGGGRLTWSVMTQYKSTLQTALTPRKPTLCPILKLSRIDPGSVVDGDCFPVKSLSCSENVFSEISI